MAVKHVELMNANNGLGCLGKAAHDEPVFILRAQDKLAAGLVRQWAEQAQAAGCNSAKVAEALECAAAMTTWPTRKYPD